MDMNLSKPQKTVKDKEAWHVAVHGVKKSWTRLNNNKRCSIWGWREEKGVPCCYGDRYTVGRGDPGWEGRTGDMLHRLCWSSPSWEETLRVRREARVTRDHICPVFGTLFEREPPPGAVVLGIGAENKPPVFAHLLLGVKSHGWRSLVGCSPWGR